MGRLNVLTGLKSGTDIPLEDESMVLGRLPTCDIVLPDHTVSRHHARITHRNDGFYLEDLQSRNGTYVNGRRIENTVRLKDRDQIQLYDISLTFLEGLSAVTGHTPHPWSAASLSDQLEKSPTTETVAEMDVLLDDSDRPHNNAEIRLQLILEVTRCLETPFDRDQMLSRLMQRLAIIFPQCDRGYILLTDESGQLLNPVAIRQKDHSSCNPRTVRPVTQSIARQVLRDGKAILSVDRIRPDDRDSVLDTEYRSIMCAPLIGTSKKPFGIIYIDSDDVPHRFTPEDLNILTCVAILTGQALEQESHHTAKYRAVVDTAADGIITVNSEGRIESANLAVEKLFGWPIKDLVGRSADDLIAGGLNSPPNGSNGDGNNGDARNANGREVLARNHQGRTFPIHLSVGHFELGGKQFHTGILHDISQRKQAESQLKRSQQELRDFVENAVEGLHWLSPDGTIQWVNRAELELLGHESEEVVGRPFADFHADDAEAAELWSRMQAGEEIRNFPARLRCKDGGVRDVLVSSTIYRPEGKIVQHRCFIRDVTEKKKAEEILRSVNENLELQVRDRTQSVRLLQDVAVIANEAETIQQALKAAMNRICRNMNWELGHAFLADPFDPDTFIDSGIWTSDRDLKYHPLRDASRSVRFRKGNGLIGKVLQTQQPAWIENPADGTAFLRADALTEFAFKFVLAFPVILGDQVVAVMEFFSLTATEPDVALLQLMQNVGTQLSRVVERRRLQEELIDAVWEQQRHFGQELHDTLGQELTGIGMMIGSLNRMLEGQETEASEMVHEIAGMIQTAKTGVRRLAKGLFPVEVDAEGLRAALGDLAKSTQDRCDVACEFQLRGRGELTDNIAATHLFRIAQEAVNNAVKHSRAQRIDITLEADNGSVALIIADDGRGLGHGSSDRASGMGLRIMRYRANLIGAAFEIGNAPSGGTTVSCRLQSDRPNSNGNGDNGANN